MILDALIANHACTTKVLSTKAISQQNRTANGMAFVLCKRWTSTTASSLLNVSSEITLYVPELQFLLLQVCYFCGYYVLLSSQP